MLHWSSQSRAITHPSRNQVKSGSFGCTDDEWVAAPMTGREVDCGRLQGNGADMKNGPVNETVTVYLETT